LNSIDCIRVAAYFDDNPLRSAIHHLKYRNNKAISSILGKILFDAYRRNKFSPDVIVPVPLHRARLGERGYNQSELLARELGTLTGLPLDTTTVQRRRNTASQMELGAQERHKNVAGAFACCNTQLVRQNVLIVDDVCTTGATLDECATALKNSGSISVEGLALARAG
jgi:ComF family protein